MLMGQPFKLLLNPPHARKKKKTFLQNIIKEKKGIKKKHRGSKRKFYIYTLFA